MRLGSARLYCTGAVGKRDCGHLRELVCEAGRCKDGLVREGNLDEPHVVLNGLQNLREEQQQHLRDMGMAMGMDGPSHTLGASAERTPP